MYFDKLNKPYSIAPPPYLLDSKKDYYVYEWFIKKTGEVFYIGKGKNQRYKDKRKRNGDFKKLINNFEVDVRKVKENLTEYDAYLFEENYIFYHLSNGKNLLNIDVIGVDYTDKLLFDLNSCGINPIIYSRYILKEIVTSNKLGIILDFVDYAFRKVISQPFDNVDEAKLCNIDFISNEHLPFSNFSDYLYNIYNNLTDTKFDNINDHINYYKKFALNFRDRNASKYLSKNNKLESVICCTYITYDEYLKYKSEGIEVYHLSDVINFINKCS